MPKDSQKLYIVHISIHGLIRGYDLELGRDPDTGGQTKYVVELVRALAEEQDVERVELVTRRIEDPGVSSDYAEPLESLSGKSQIVRLEAGPKQYLAKEKLWDYLDAFADSLIAHLSDQDRLPDWIHSHYADAGYVGTRVGKVLGIPLVHTGHSLGRVKRRRLIAKGSSSEQIEKTYKISRRIHAEENTLANALRVIVSTHNEIHDQYELYDYYHPECMEVIAPGTDLSQFHPPVGNAADSDIAAQINRFFGDPDKPAILALSRPDERKNIATLVRVYGESEALQKAANLILITGNRDDIRELDPGARKVMTDILLLIDHYDLYGKVAYPKHHLTSEVSQIYQLASQSGGVFVNPALTEPFGLTLLEAAASGLPLVATRDGGPTDIIGNCDNGILVDPLDRTEIGNALLSLLGDRELHQRYANNGLRGVKAHYSWPTHARTYLDLLKPLMDAEQHFPQTRKSWRRGGLYHDRLIITDIDQNLLGDLAALKEFTDFVRANRKCAAFGVATARRWDSALYTLRQYEIPMPDVLISSGGTEIYHAPRLSPDEEWANYIDNNWNRDKIRKLLKDVPGIVPQAEGEQGTFKLSYYYDSQQAPSKQELDSMLLQAEQSVTTIIGYQRFLDVLPHRACKGLALRYVANKLNIPMDHILVAGGAGADEGMMHGNTLAVVVANRQNEALEEMADSDQIYFAKSAFAQGILEAVDYYDFFGECRVPLDDWE